MAWVEVESSWLQAVQYEAETGVLMVRFHKRGVPTFTARYDNVDPGTALGLLAAGSKGKYFHESGLYRRKYVAV